MWKYVSCSVSSLKARLEGFYVHVPCPTEFRIIWNCSCKKYNNVGKLCTLNVFSFFCIFYLYRFFNEKEEHPKFFFWSQRTALCWMSFHGYFHEFKEENSDIMKVVKFIPLPYIHFIDDIYTLNMLLQLHQFHLTIQKLLFLQKVQLLYV